MSTPRELLEHAVTVLDEEGWVQKTYGPVEEAGGHCAVGSIYRAWWLETGENYVHRRGEASPVVGGAERIIADVVYTATRWGTVPRFNDALDTTEEDVKSMFQLAIKEAIKLEERA